MSRRLGSVLAHLRRTLGRSQAEGLPDAELLDRFVRLRDEAAFELLVWRHQNMVFGVCRRLLHNEHDAEDAFQATFLTLSRKAASIGRREAVASWLYQVAYRCAVRMRRTLQRQRQGVVSGIASVDVAVPDAGLATIEDSDLRVLIDEEVQRLPAKYRTAVILCYLEGKSYQQAAQELGCPAGTLSTRLHTAREKLRRRLTARGLAPAAVLTLLESARETHAAARLAAVAVQAARQILAGQSAADVVSSRTLEICTGVMQTMSASKAKTVVIVLLMGCLTGLTGWTVVRALPQAPRKQHAENADKPMSSKQGRKPLTWQECALLRGAARQFFVEFAPDNGALAAIDGDNVLRVWNTSDWEQRWQYDLRRRYGGNFQHFTQFSPDGRLLGVLGRVTDGNKPGQSKEEVTLLDAASGRELASLPGSRLAYAPDKATLATSQKDSISLWDARTFQKKREFKADEPPDSSWMIRFSKDASLICVQTKKGRCYLWETATGKERARPEGFLPAFSPDGKTLLTLLPGGVIKLWDTADGRERAVIRKAGRTGCFHNGFSPDSKLVLVWASFGLKVDGTPDVAVRPSKRTTRIRQIDICLYDAATGKERRCLPGRLPSEDLYDVSAQLAPDGRTVAYTRLEAEENKRKEVVLWDVPSGRERAVLRTPVGVRTPQFSLAAPFSPDGAVVLTTDPSLENLRLWDVATGWRLLDLPAEVGFVHFSPDGQWLAGVPGRILRGKAGDIRVFHRSDKSLPPPVIRGDATKPSPPPP